MKTLPLILFFGLFSFCLSAQTNEDLNKLHQEKISAISDLQDQLKVLEDEAELIKKEMSSEGGWSRGLNGLIGFDWNNSNGWISNPNPDARSSALSLGITAYAMKDSENHSR